ncbi:unnamed protein product [Gongylonema pulchrum]|uniref:ubiquitinyl hydrolase 1 n=1 Tax=Gongylonema pulchrum TaxID=637853 RepID=A0A183DZQ3_9BILA|nr:unnamed protein product [Gongylonema pulchrum]
METSNRQSLLEAFRNETHATHTVALAFLEEHGWDYEKSLKGYNAWRDKEAAALRSGQSDAQERGKDADLTDEASSKLNGEVEVTLRAPAYAFVLPNLFELAADFRNFLEKDLIETGSRRHTLWRRWRWAESKSNLQSGLVLTDEEWQREWDNILHMAAATPRTLTNFSEQVYESLESIHVFALAHILKRPIVEPTFAVVSDTVLRNAAGEELSPIPFGGIYLPLECPSAQCHRSPLVLCYDSAHFSALVTMRHTPNNTLQLVSDTVLRNAAGEELSPIPFGGIYLPLECPSAQCHRSPLVLCYDSAHFSALVTMRHTPNNTLQPIIPITDRNRNLLPLHFSVDPGPDFTWWKDSEDAEIAARIELTESDKLSLICEYMDIIKIENTCEGASEQVRVSDLHSANRVVAAQLHSHAHEYMDHMVESYLCSARERFEQSKNTPGMTSRQRARLSHSFSTSSLSITCINNHCQKSASQSTNFLCDDCYEYQKQLMASFGCSQPGHLRSLRSCLATAAQNSSNSSLRNGTSSVKSNTMPSIAFASFATTAPAHADEKDGRDAVHRTSISVVAPSFSSESQNSCTASSPRHHFGERVAAGCEGNSYDVFVEIPSVFSSYDL